MLITPVMDVDDQVCFGRIKTQDYKLKELVLTPEPASKHLIDYHVKLLLKEDIKLHPGHEVLVETSCIIGDGNEDFCLHIKKSYLHKGVYLVKHKDYGVKGVSNTIINFSMKLARKKIYNYIILIL